MTPEHQPARPTSRRELREASRAQGRDRRRAPETGATLLPAQAVAETVGETVAVPARPAGRRELRAAASRARALGRVRRYRRFSRAGLAVAVAVLLPSAALGGVALAAGNDVTLQPGGSFVKDSGTDFSEGQAGITFALPGRPSGQSLYLGVELRQTKSGLYRAKARVYPDGALSVDVGKVVAGQEYYLGSQRIPAKVAAGATAVHVQGGVYGTTTATVGVRAWVNGEQAPANWQLVVSDPAPVTGSGSVRGWAYLSSSATAPLQLAYGGLAGAATGNGGTTTPTAGPTASPSAGPTPSATPKPPTGGGNDTGGTGSGGNASAGMAAVLAKAGAAGTTNYSIPSDAVYVSPKGSNGNAGTAGSPLRTVAAGVAKASSGGTVVLRGGTYREAVGSVNKKLSIQAYPGEKPVLSGADVEDDWSKSGDYWVSGWTSSFSQTQFRGEETPSGTAAGRVEQVFRDGQALKQVLNKSELKGAKFWLDPSSMHVYVAQDPGNATMEISTRTRGMTLEAGAAGSKILGLRFTAYAAPHLDNSGGLYVSAARSVIENSTFDHSSGAGLKIAAGDLTVNRITVRDNAAEGMQGNRNDGSVVKNSLFQGNNTDDFKVWQCGGSCTVAGFKTAHTDDLEVYDNAFVDNNSNGFWCDLGCTNVKITGNAITGSYDGIFYEVSSKGTITGNYVEKSDKGIRVSGSDHVTISGNKLVNNNWQLTVYDDRRSSSTDSYSSGLGLSWNTTDLVIKDNTIVGGADTTKLLENNATAQVTAKQMFKTLSGNSYSGDQTMMWCPSDNKCSTYGSVQAWKSASGLGF
ncbi:right-handed parallel beta-helix repeat-containing protein [Spongisporangium articulatum]|uniref:Right-handed parallel beta-helix repeat-containing protein n=1 Tax=Spongisporangium articulatum TaxID=3362603 RepID=A0ABW8AUQ6_9ACTN